MNNNQLEILDILAHNSKATVKDIDNLTGIGEDEIVKIIKDYEDTGVIVKYKTLINWEAAGREEVRALVEVRVTPQRDFGFDNVKEYINLETNELKKKENYDRYSFEGVCDWWRNKASKRYDTLKSDGRLRTDIEVWTNGDGIDIIR